MESPCPENLAYDSLIWLLVPKYNKEAKVYSPNQFLVEAIIDKLPLEEDQIVLYRGNLYNFKLVSDTYRYFDSINNLTDRFSNSLVVIPFETQDLIVRDVYMARLAKLYTTWSTCYIDCPDPTIVTSKAFDFVVPHDGRAEILKTIIEGKQ